MPDLVFRLPTVFLDDLLFKLANTPSKKQPETSKRQPEKHRSLKPPKAHIAVIPAQAGILSESLHLADKPTPPKPATKIPPARA